MFFSGPKLVAGLGPAAPEVEPKSTGAGRSAESAVGASCGRIRDHCLPLPRHPRRSWTNTRARPYLLLLCLALIWGTHWPVSKIGLRDLPPFTYGTLRVVTGVATLAGQMAEDSQRIEISGVVRDARIDGASCRSRTAATFR